MKKIAIANQKGGVGKTTTAVNLATAMAAVGCKTLLLDFDPQGNASTGLGIDWRGRPSGAYEFLMGQGGGVVDTLVPGLSVLPGSVHLAGAEVELVSAPEREFFLRRALGSLEGFDYVFVDCPPSLGLLTVNALCACDSIIAPLQCEFFALEGISQLFKTVELIKAYYNPQLYVQGVVMTMFDARNGLNQSVVADVRAHFHSLVYETLIPRNVKISESPSYGKPALIYDLKSAGSQAYLRLARELLRQERRKTYAAA